MEKLFTTRDSWIEGSAVAQLQQTDKLKGVIKTVGMPDLHPGKGCAVGTACYTKGIVYPHLIGSDIGCGYSLFQTTISASNVNSKFLASCLSGLDNPWDGNAVEFLYNYNLDLTDSITSLGTIGGGNHFAELQKVIAVNNQDALNKAFINPDYLLLLVHSGSRSLGNDIFTRYAALSGSAGLDLESDLFKDYICEHNDAIQWAKANRGLIAYRMLEALESGSRFILDLPHNFIEQYKDGYVHRKGAAPADRGISPLPGSRGSNTYLLRPYEENDDSLASLAHGAGRKTSRADMHDKFSKVQKKNTHLLENSTIVCGDTELMREEHPTAYKSIDQVLLDLQFHKLAEPIATLTPVLTYKSDPIKFSSRNSSKRTKEEGWRKQRREANRK